MKKAPKKKTSPLKQLKTKKGFALFVGVFALVGAAYLITTFAAPYLKPIDPRQVIAGTYELKPTIIKKEKGSDIATYVSQSKTQLVLSDGSIICNDAAKNGLVKVGDISKEELNTIKADIKQFRESNPDNVQPQPQISNVSGVIVSDKRSAENSSFVADRNKPKTVTDLEGRLDELCASSTTSEIKEEDVVEPILPSTRQAVNSESENLLDTISGLFVGKAYATPPAKYGTANPSFATHLEARQNQLRVGNRQFALTTNHCLNYFAYFRAARLVDANYIYHAPNTLAEAIYICNKEGLNWNTWTFIGENVGVDTDAEHMFGLYVNSRLHREHILSNSNRCQGNGAYKSTRNASTFHALISAAWRGGGCQR